MTGAIIAFLDSDSFENSIRIAISLGGDADIVGCITGAIAQVYYGEIAPFMISTAEKLLPAEFLKIITRFNTKFQAGRRSF
jgi:ADP-ribosylglycohydrolase